MGRWILMEEYYRFGSNFKNKKKPYASKIIRDKKIFKECFQCGSLYLHEEIRETTLMVEGKGKLPDIILCGHYPLIIVSEKVLDAWEKEYLTGYDSFIVKLINSEMVEISKEIKYYNIIITGRADLDFEKMGIKIISKCSECGQVKFDKESWEFGTAILKEGTYNNSDLFVLNHFEGVPLCNKKNLEIIYKYELTNFRFEKIDTMFDYMATEIDIKSLFE